MFDFKPKYISQTWGETYLIEPIEGVFYYVYYLCGEDYPKPIVGHGGPTTTPDDRFADRKPINNLFINPLVLEYIESHKEAWSERLNRIIEMQNSEV